MRKLYSIAIVIWLFTVACSSGVFLTKFSGIGPGMSCPDMDAYLGAQKIKFKKEGNKYNFELKDESWADAEVYCEGAINKMVFNSKKGTSVAEAKAYIDVQTLLLNAFRDNMITYEEGNKIINLNNGVKLHQFTDAGSGVITNFSVSVENTAGAADAWKITSLVLPKVGVKE